MKLPALVELEAELIRRGIVDTKALAEDFEDLPEAIQRADRLVNEVRRWLAGEIGKAKAKVNMPELERAIRNGAQAEIWETLRLRELIGDLKPGATERLKTAYLTGAKVGAEVLTKLDIPPIRFNYLDPHAVQWANKNAARLVTEIDQGQRDMVRTLVVRAQQFGRTVQETARDLRDVVGLHSRQVVAVEKFRARLVEQEVAQEKIDARVSRYAAAQLRARTEMIARTEIVAAGNAGQQGAWREAAAEGLLDLQHAYRTWIVTNDDLLDTVLCEPMADAEAKLTEPWLLPDGRSVMLPQESHPQCFLPGTRVSGEVQLGLIAWYDGPAVEIRTARGYCLAITINHPVLTTQGWIAAGQLCDGDDVLCDSSPVWPLSDSGMDDEQAPALVEEIAEALRSDGLASAHVGSLDLYGDALFCKAEIDIVGAARILRYDPQASGTEKIVQDAFARRHYRQSLRTSSGSADQFSGRLDTASRSFPRGTALTFNEPTVCLDRSPLERLCLGLAAQSYLPVAQRARDRGARDTKLFAQLLQRGTSQVTRDKIVSIRRFPFSGHVYSFQTRTGWIIAQSIVTSNCRCSEGLVVKE